MIEKTYPVLVSLSKKQVDLLLNIMQAFDSIMRFARPEMLPEVAKLRETLTRTQAVRYALYDIARHELLPYHYRTYAEACADGALELSTVIIVTFTTGEMHIEKEE